MPARIEEIENAEEEGVEFMLSLTPRGSLTTDEGCWGHGVREDGAG